MSGNSSGTRKYRTTIANAMNAFDKLPSEARVALANAAGNWVPQPFLTKYRRGEFDAAGLAKWIGILNDVELAEREHQRARAIGVYKGNKPDAGTAERSARRRRRP